MNAVHPLQTSSRRWLPLQPAEWALLVAAAALLAFAVWGPFLPASAHQHDFADQRGWQGLPCALDVLSNLPFAVAGAWGLVWLRRLGALRLCPATRATAALFFGGLVLTAVGSGWYHWQPDDAGLLWDRLGMAAAFAGLLGLAVWGASAPGRAWPARWACWWPGLLPCWYGPTRATCCPGRWCSSAACWRCWPWHACPTAMVRWWCSGAR